MHTLAAHYPRAPNAVERAHAAGFFRALSALYPCTHCRDDFRAALAAEPPRRVAGGKEGGGGMRQRRIAA